MKSYINGFIINVQFFTMIPIRKEVPITNNNMERAIRTLPLLGLVFGMMYASLTYFLIEMTSLSALLIAFILWLLPIILTGAIHLDGWIDTCDAFFSYQDRKKRLDIMTEPQAGAFGVIGVIVLLATKFIVIYEIILQVETVTYLFILFIPFFSRMLTGIVLSKVSTAKKDGLGFLFQQAVTKGTLRFYTFYIILLPLLIWVWHEFYGLLVFFLFVSMLFTFIFVRIKAVQWFGGITGDIIGAAQEGVEVLLWIIVLVLHYFVMG